MTKKNISRPLLLFVSAWSIGAAGDEAYTINVQISGGDPHTGQILVSLFNSEDNYLKAPIEELAVPVNENGSASLSFTVHSASVYAIVAVYDRNGNGRLDTGMFRIPRELIGYSNNAQNRFGPAKWKDVRFELSGSQTSVAIRLGPAG